MDNKSIIHLGLLEDEAIVLDTAALELALLDHPYTELDSYTDLLGSIAERADILGRGATSAHQQAEVLAGIIAGEFGFEGDQLMYDSPDNADLIRVIDRRRGLPVSLTILYVAAARRIGWSAEALNTPGHVLGRIGDETDMVLVDPFSRGAIVEAEDLAALLGRVLGGATRPTSEHLAPMSNRSILVRLLMNQTSRAERNGNIARALELCQRMTTIAPGHPHPWWDRARLEVAQGDPAAARSSLSAMLEVTREPGLRNHIFAALDALSRLSH